MLPYELQAGRRLVMPLDDDMLEQLTETRFHGALVTTVHLEVVRNRALLAHVPVGLHEHHPRSVAKPGPARFELLERGQPRLDARQLLLARPDMACLPFMLETRARQFGLARGTFYPDALERLVRTAERLGRKLLLGVDF